MQIIFVKIRWMCITSSDSGVLQGIHFVYGFFVIVSLAWPHFYLSGWEAEADVPFHEHIFLEHHLTGFPDIVPISHFMELVVTGLSKNPYMSVQQKIEHINWFREYFEEKKPVLDEYVKNAQVQKDNPELLS